MPRTRLAVSARTGHINWIYHASGAVKGGPALVNNVLYFGDYAVRAYAINASDGHQIWAVSTDGTHFGFGSGNFYSSPAVAFGRVYMGNTDGRVYSFATSNGALAWATETGDYVYASPAVADIAGLGPTVYIGSYNGEFYALNAQSGANRWEHNAGGKVSGSATIIGKVVYYSDLGSKTSTGLDVHTGRQVFFFPDGIFNAVVADYHAIFLSGKSAIYELLPKRSASPYPPAAEPARRSKRATKHPKRALKHNKKR
jgi:outer membrane protein assembly factor BamB